MSTYEKLPQSKLKNGYIYTLVTRNDKAAIYSMKNEKFPEDVSIGYEVFKISVGKAYSLVQKHGNKKGQVYNYPAAEKFASNEDGGKTLWTYTTKDAAMKRFAELTNA
jgi:hypothetical protein